MLRFDRNQNLKERKLGKACLQKIAVISGGSGSGKTSVVNALLKQFPKKTERVITATSRAPREGEVDERDYFFYKPAKFEQMIRQGDFVEWAEVYGNYYGTPFVGILHALDTLADIVLVSIDVQGHRNLRQCPHLRFQGCIYSIFLDVSPEELKVRLETEGNRNNIEKRLAEAAAERAQAHLYDTVIINRNGKFDETISQACQFLGL